MLVTSHALAVAANALAARGYLRYVKDSATDAIPVVHMPSYVIALVGTCAFNDLGVVFQLRTIKPKHVSLCYIHVAAVSHFPSPGRQTGLQETMEAQNASHFQFLSSSSFLLSSLGCTRKKRRAAIMRRHSFPESASIAC